MEKKLNLYQKIQEVSLAVMNIEKDMTVGKGNYSYKAVSDTQVTLQVKKAEKEAGILSIVVKQDLINSEILKQRNGDKESHIFVDTVKMTVRIIDLDDPSSYIDIESFGKGIDSADKGFGKASTYARKYALLNAYKIATGEDPDADKSPKIDATSKNEKKEAVLSVCLKNEKIKENILSHFSLGSLDDLSDIQVETIYNQFKTKGKL